MKSKEKGVSLAFVVRGGKRGGKKDIYTRFLGRPLSLGEQGGRTVGHKGKTKGDRTVSPLGRDFNK